MKKMYRYDATMRPVPSHILRSLEIQAPQFMRAVERSDDEIALPWSLFGDEPELVYHCIWYALCQGKTVVIEPPI